MLKDIFVAVTIIFGFHLCECMRKNVCKNLEDYRTIQQNPNCWYNPDVGASPEQIAKRYGFPFESYKVTTKDGYILSLFRIPHNGSDINRKRPPVILQHGIAVDSRTWMSLGLESIVFVFANKGYDVWLPNSRGNHYSSKHVKYTVYDPRYWNFSFHEMGIYDVPAMVDFIAAKTKQKRQITFIGHSMGCTMSYVYASLKPEHAVDNLKSLISLAPVAYMDHVGPMVKAIVPLRYLIWNFFSSIGLYGFGPNTELKFDLIHRLCSEYPFIETCINFIKSAGGGTTEDQLVPSAYPVVFSGYPSGLSLKTLLHYAQIASTTQRFQFFDYGIRKNLKLYNSSVPLEYPLSRIKIPVHIFYGKNDDLAAEKDVYNLFNKLETEKTIMEVFSFAHSSFLLGRQSYNFYQILLQVLGKN